MPIFEYACVKCQRSVEHFQRRREEEAPKCEQCGSQMERKMSVGSFILKGSGWYATDYKKGACESEQSGSCCACTGNTCPHA